jgi:hypothetical protein
MTRKREYEVETMKADELRALIAECDRRVRALQAPYAKARREWGALGQRARRELERRG